MKSQIKYRITSRFGDIDSIRNNIPHTGLDFAMKTGEPLYTIQSGTVIKLSERTNLGNGVFIQWADGKTAIYGHLSKFADIKVGDKLQAGDLIGWAGSTGNSTGSHLHLAIHNGDKFIDPEPYANLIQNMDKLKAVVENAPLPEFKFSIPEFLSSANPDNFNGFLNMLKANFINYTQLFDYTIFLQHFHNFIQFFF